MDVVVEIILYVPRTMHVVNPHSDAVVDSFCSLLGFHDFSIKQFIVYLFQSGFLFIHWLSSFTV